MKKNLKPIILIGLVGILFAVHSENMNFQNEMTAYAGTINKKSKWHKGTPKELRGNYEWINHKNPNGASNSWAVVRITLHGFHHEGQGMPAHIGYNAKYRRIGRHKYLLKQDVAKNGLVLGGKNYKIYIEKKKNKLFFSYTKNERSNYFSKVKKNVMPDDTIAFVLKSNNKK